MVKLSSKTLNLLKDDIISILYENNLKPLLTKEIASELRRDKEFTKTLLNELKQQGILTEVKKNNKGKDYIKRIKWIIKPELIKNMKIRNKAVPAVYILLEQDEKILLGRRYNTGYEDGNYQVPAGHVEEGELPTEAIIREVKEEVNVDLASENLELIHVGYRPKHDPSGDRIDLFFKAKKWSGVVKNREPAKCDDLQWFSWDTLPENTVFHVLEAFEHIRKGIFYHEIGIDVLKEKGLYKL
jgi:ADP-ribose pyrophosphatase YjhB (NUDIX family)